MHLDKPSYGTYFIKKSEAMHVAAASIELYLGKPFKALQDLMMAGVEECQARDMIDCYLKSPPTHQVHPLESFQWSKLFYRKLQEIPRIDTEED